MLQVDSPSLFTSLSPDEVELELFDRDPTLFDKYILPWLAGYTIDFAALALDPVTLANVKNDAKYYGLTRLQVALKDSSIVDNTDKISDVEYGSSGEAVACTAILTGISARFTYAVLKYGNPPPIIVTLHVDQQKRQSFANLFGIPPVSRLPYFIPKDDASLTCVPVLIRDLHSEFAGSLSEFQKLLNHRSCGSGELDAHHKICLEMLDRWGKRSEHEGSLFETTFSAKKVVVKLSLVQDSLTVSEVKALSLLTPLRASYERHIATEKF